MAGPKHVSAKSAHTEPAVSAPDPLKASEPLSADKPAQAAATACEYPLLPLWADDSKHEACQECSQPFGFFVRRHHCRACGRVLCGDCCCDLGFTVWHRAKVRVCRACNSGTRKPLTKTYVVGDSTGSVVRKTLRDPVPAFHLPEDGPATAALSEPLRRVLRSFPIISRAARWRRRLTVTVKSCERLPPVARDGTCRPAVAVSLGGSVAALQPTGAAVNSASLDQTLSFVLDHQQRDASLEFRVTAGEQESTWLGNACLWPNKLPVGTPVTVHAPLTPNVNKPPLPPVVLVLSLELSEPELDELCFAPTQNGVQSRRGGAGRRATVV